MFESQMILLVAHHLITSKAKVGWTLGPAHAAAGVPRLSRLQGGVDRKLTVLPGKLCHVNLRS
jgi:hypothetical protein